VLRFFALAGLFVLGALTVMAAVIGGPGWWVLLAVIVLLAGVGVYDLLQRKHSILRNYPVLGHMRFLLESIRPELQQYFIERNYDGRPYDRDTRTSIYTRAKGQNTEQPFGTERDVNEIGYEYLVHSTKPVDVAKEAPRVRIGGPDCTRPYDMALLNVSAMSFGALSANALTALNAGAARGGFAHDTGEGGISKYHRQGGDLVWELGSGYFGARAKDGGFDEAKFADKAADDQIKLVSLKLSQGAKPGIGGVLPAAKVTKEIADARDVPKGEKCVSPSYHRVFSTPRELLLFIARMRELSGGKPAGFKLCVGSRADVLGICKAMVEEVHPGPDLPHEHLPGRRRHPGSQAHARARRARQDRPGGALPAGGRRAGHAGDRLDGSLRPARAHAAHAPPTSRPLAHRELRRALRAARARAAARRGPACLAEGLGTGRCRRLPPLTDQPDQPDQPLSVPADRPTQRGTP
jgi:hypothetical protein